MKLQFLSSVFFIAFAGSNAIKDTINPKTKIVTIIESPNDDQGVIYTPANNEILYKEEEGETDDDSAPLLMKRGKGHKWKHGGRWNRKPWKHGGYYGRGRRWGRKPWKNGKYGGYGGGGPGYYNGPDNWD